MPHFDLAARQLMPEDLAAFIRQHLQSSHRSRDWAVGGAWLTGPLGGSPVQPPGWAASIANALMEWIRKVVPVPGLQGISGTSLLTERAAFMGLTRNGSVSPGGGAQLLTSRTGDLMAVSCARLDDPLLYGAALAREVDPAAPWPDLTMGVAEHDTEHLLSYALDLGLPMWKVSAGDGRDIKTELPVTQNIPNQVRVPRKMPGARVLDFSSLWAGPLATHLLTLAGADVIKVESAHRLDGARLGHPGVYELLHAGQRSVTFDPLDPQSLKQLRELAARADVIIEASRPRALERLGLSADAHVTRGQTWVSITAAGRGSNRVGFGDDVAASAGLIAVDPRTGPCFVGDAIADPLTGLLVAALVSTRPEDGHGELWDVSMSDLMKLTLLDPNASFPRADDVHVAPVPPKMRHGDPSLTPAPEPGTTSLHDALAHWESSTP